MYPSSNQCHNRHRCEKVNKVYFPTFQFHSQLVSVSPSSSDPRRTPRGAFTSWSRPGDTSNFLLGVAPCSVVAGKTTPHRCSKAIHKALL